MLSRRFSLALLLAAAVAATALVLVPLTASKASTRRAMPSLPRVPQNFNAGLKSLLIRPTAIFYTGDGTGLLAGSNVRNADRSGLHWSSWTTTTALGTGDNLLNNCEPSCAGGKFTGYPVRLEAWRPAVLHGETVFTRLTIWYTGKRPAGEPAHYTFTDVYDGGWGFGPPDANGYCVKTEGQPRAAGCANINALPPAT